jgi:GNAT superfamily N-acetyltransferase
LLLGDVRLICVECVSIWRKEGVDISYSHKMRGEILMSFLLQPDNYSSIYSLFEGMTYHLAVQTALAGILPGRIYVDDPARPGAVVLIPSNRHRIYVSGEHAQSILVDVMHILFKESSEESYEFVVYYDAATVWKQSLEQVLQEQKIFPGWRQLYRLREPSSPATGHLPESIAFARIDETILDDPSLVNGQHLLEEILSVSLSLEHFFRHNFGFCAQDGRKLVAWCLAEYHYQGRYELGIETIEAYQRKGIATHLAEAVIRHAFARGATEIGWHCWATNAPSIATALRLGFEKVLDYPVYYVQF